MSSLRNAVKRREHKERGQLRDRKKLGLLEKHKDYALRARDYNNKQARLQSMQLKAAFRNPDEFYFRMNTTKTDNGIHISTNNQHDVKLLTTESLKVLKTQDLAYLQMKRLMDLRKAERLNQSLHFIDAPKDNKHIVYVDSSKDVETFDPVDHFDTVPELVDQPYNRLRKETLKAKHGTISSQDIRKLNTHRNGSYREMNERLLRASKLSGMCIKLDVERKVQAKGKKRKIKDAVNGKPAVYKWKKQRQK